MTTIKNRDHLLKENIKTELEKLKSEGFEDAQIKQVHAALKSAFQASPSDFDQLEGHVIDAIKANLNPDIVEEHAIKAAQSAIESAQKDFEKQVVPAYLKRIEEDQAEKKRLADALEKATSDKDELKGLVTAQSEQLAAAVKIISSVKDGEISKELKDLSSKVQAVDEYQRKADKALAERLKSDEKSDKLISDFLPKLESHTKSVEEKLDGHILSVDARVDSIKGVVVSGLERAKVFAESMKESTASSVRAGFKEFAGELGSLRKTAAGMVGLLKNFGDVYDNLKTSAEESAEVFAGKLEEGSAKVDQVVDSLDQSRKQMDTTASYFNTARIELGSEISRLEQSSHSVEFKVTSAAMNLNRVASNELSKQGEESIKILQRIKSFSDDELRETGNQLTRSANTFMNEVKASMGTVNGLYDQVSELSEEVRKMKETFDPETAGRVQEQLNEIGSKLEELKDEDSYKGQIDELNKRTEQLMSMLEELMNPEKNNNNEG